MSRPYEYVIKAWHNERQQPIRGSLIKQIFKIAHKIHSPSTKKKKEWQEKLPIVVLKAEEIMYSKANSQAEYMDRNTMWERVNDAIGIIRQNDSDETRDFLLPCIEASLNRGCITRASRRQRNGNSSFYLGSYYPQPPDTEPAFEEPTTMTNRPMLIDDKLMETGMTQCESDELACDLSLRLAPLSVSGDRETRKRRAMEVDHPCQPKLHCTYVPSSAGLAG